MPDAGLHETPEGIGEPLAWVQERVTVWAGVFAKKPVIVIGPELPRATVMPPRLEEFPELYRRKSKVIGETIVNDPE